jgi:hypothetical protein
MSLTAPTVWWMDFQFLLLYRRRAAFYSHSYHFFYVNIKNIKNIVIYSAFTVFTYLFSEAFQRHFRVFPNFLSSLCAFSEIFVSHVLWGHLDAVPCGLLVFLCDLHLHRGEIYGRHSMLDVRCMMMLT